MKNLCGSCRNCCKGPYIKINKKDISEWKEKQRYDIILCIEKWPILGAVLLKKDDGKSCIFLGKKGCEIYEDRPQVCRDFPLGPIHIKQFNCKLKI